MTPELSGIFFCCITLAAVLFFYLASGKNAKIILAAVAQLLIIGTFSASGFFEYTNGYPPRFLIVLTAAITFSIVLYRLGTAAEIKPNFVWAIHALRLPVELTLYQLYLQHKVPLIMTFEGWNLDILIGVSAIFGLAFSTGKRPLRTWAILTWNVLGLISLALIVSIAILSSPLPFQQLAFDQPNVAVLEFSFTYLPAVVVPIVLVSHPLTFRKIFSKRYF